LDLSGIRGFHSQFRHGKGRDGPVLSVSCQFLRVRDDGRAPNTVPNAVYDPIIQSRVYFHLPQFLEFTGEGSSSTDVLLAYIPIIASAMENRVLFFIAVTSWAISI